MTCACRRNAFAALRPARAGRRRGEAGRSWRGWAADGPVKIEREQSSRMAVVHANVRGRDLVGFVAEAQAAAAQKVKLPPGYSLAWAASSRTSSAPPPAWAWRVPVALASSSASAATLGSLRQALLVFANIPLGPGGRHRGPGTHGGIPVCAGVGWLHSLHGDCRAQRLVLVTCFNPAGARGMPMAGSGAPGRAAPPASGADDGQHHTARWG